MFSLSVLCWSVLAIVDSKKVFCVRLLNVSGFDNLVHARISQCLERHDVTAFFVSGTSSVTWCVTCCCSVELFNLSSSLLV